MNTGHNFTEGKILSPLLKFAMPVLLALCLQAMYGAVDLLVVGQFGTAADVSAVSTGSQIMHTITAVITGLSMGTTVLLAQKIGQGRLQEAGSVIGNAICLFTIIAVLITVVMAAMAEPLAMVMHAPREAFAKTVSYVTICSMGAVFIVAYNVLGSLFRGMGDSKTPLITVFIACIVNIAGDLLFVGVFHMAASGAALATVLAQAVSVLLCILMVQKHRLPFPFSKKHIRMQKDVIVKTLKLGLPIGLQDGLVSIPFLVILAIVNSLGVISSAGVGVAEKLCMFIMLVPSAYMQSLSAFVGQNVGARRGERAKKAMLYGMGTSFAFGVVMAYFSFFHGQFLAGFFTTDAQVMAAAAEYLKAYAIDTMLVSFLFCFIGYYNGCGKTTFVMLQGMIGAFFIRIPVSYFVSQYAAGSLFKIGLATPVSTVVQIVLCVIYFYYLSKAAGIGNGNA